MTEPAPPTPTAPADATWTQPPTPPPLTRPTAPAKRPGSRWKLWVAVGAFVLISVVSGLVVTTVRGASATPLPVEWSLTPQDVLPDEYRFGFSDALDGTEGTGYVLTDEVWVVLLTQRYSAEGETPDQLLGVDPDTGQPTWQVDLPGGVCADRPGGDGSLSCLTGTAAGWQLVRVDLATGATRDEVPVEVTDPRQVHLSADGMLVLGQSEPGAFTRLSHLAADGSVDWSTDLMDLVGGEALFRETTSPDGIDEIVLDPRAAWTDVGESVLLGRDAFAHITPGDGAVQVHQGTALAVVDDRFFYASSRGTVAYDATGAKLWYRPDVDLVRSAGDRPAETLLHLGLDDGSVRSVDPATGNLSGAARTTESSLGSVQQSGPPEDTYLIARDRVSRLSPDHGELLWEAKVSGANTTTRVYTIGDVTLVDTSPVTALEATSGEDLWTGEAASREVTVVDDRVIGFDQDEFTVHTLP